MTGEDKNTDKMGRDRTLFDVRLGSRWLPGLNKRKTIYFLVKHLVSQGIHPDDIANAMVDRGPKTWFVVDGRHDGTSFLEAAYKSAALSERTFDPDRWFADPGQLVIHDGRTYALSNQWGSETFPPTIRNFKRLFKDADFDVQPATE